MKGAKPSVLSSKVDYQNPRFRVLHDQLEWPNGYIGDYYIFEAKPCVIIIASRDEQILVVEQYRYTIDEVTTEFPMGGVEEGEEPEAAARRELFEETGHGAERFELVARQARAVGSTRKWCYVFVAHEPVSHSNTPARDVTEDDVKWKWIPLSEFRAKIQRGEIISQDSMAAWGVYREQES